MLAFSLLGSFGIETDDGPLVSALPRRCVSLVGYLLLRRSERVYRDRLASTLWPDARDVEARGKLRRHLYLVGQAIPQSRRDEWFLFDATTVGWNPSVAATTDVELLRDAVRTERWRSAVEQYRGELLAECDDEWLVDERDRLREGHVTNLERLALQARAAGSLSAAVEAAQELLRLEPWREAALRVLMETRYAMGDRAGALAEFERFSQRLRDDLDVEPMVETTALYADLIARTTHVTQQVPAESPCSEPATDPTVPFVGREVQLETLRETWSRALQHRGGVAFVGGESGVGKTRLVDELATCVVADRGLILRGGTTFIEPSPYQAVVEALRSGLDLLERRADETPWRSALATVLPELQSRHAGDIAAALGPEAERSRLFEAVVAALQSLAAAQPVLLILEDLHWAGSGTIALLAHIARRVARDRIAIVGTYRDDDLPRAHPLRDLRRQLGREGTASIVSLGPLTAGDVERFFTLRFGAATGAGVSARYHSATDGLPLFLIELLADVTDDRTLPVVPAPQFPQSLAATIERRLTDLPDSARAAMEIAAVIGAGFDLELVAAASGWGDAETLLHVGELIEKHVVREVPGGGAAYAFAHAFYRENAYARIPLAKRRQRHARVAQALSGLYADRLSELAPELARHYEEAGDVERAVEHLIESVRRASGLFANEDALAYAERALVLSPQPRPELDLRLLREEAYRRSGNRDGQRAELDGAGVLAQALADADATNEIAHRRIALSHALGDRESERREIELAQALLERPDSAWGAKLALARGKHHLRGSALREARDELTAAAAIFEALGEPHGAFETFLTLLEVERSCEALEAVERCFAGAERQLARLEDSRALVMRLYEERANHALLRQQYLEADAWAARFLEATHVAGDVAGQARAYRLVGSAAAWRLDVVAARTHLERASTLFEAIGDRFQVYAVGYEFALLAVWLGHVDEAVVRFERALAAAEALDFHYGVAACCISLGHARTLATDHLRAESDARRAIEIAQNLGAESLLAPALVNLGIALVQRGLPNDAEAPLLRGRSLAERADRPDLLAEAWSYLALVHALKNDAAAAAAASRETLRLMLTIPQPLRSGSRYWVVAQALRRGGDVPAAAQAIRDGRAVVSAQLESIPDAESRGAFAALAAHHALLTESQPDEQSDVFRTVYA